MINNRQPGRRRGRNNPRQNGGGNRGNGGDSGNRIDNRARGNAPQLLEKYKNLARDAQMSGDRVQAEYYLQFADHYFRVLADNRARQEENQQRFRRYDEGDQDEDFGDEGDFYSDRSDQREAPPREADGNRGFEREGNREPGHDGPQNGGRRDTGRRAERAPRDGDARATRQSGSSERDGGADEFQQPGTVAGETEMRRERPARTRRPRRDDAGDSPRIEEPSFDSAVLPPSIGRVASDGDEAGPGPDASTPGDASAEAAPAPRRTRRPRAAPQAAE